MPLKNYRWFIEYFSPEEGHLHGIREVLFSKQTPFQSMDILELGSYGKSLVLDGKIQSTHPDEFIYHETLVHPAMLTHPDPRRSSSWGAGRGPRCGRCSGTGASSERSWWTSTKRS